MGKDLTKSPSQMSERAIKVIRLESTYLIRCLQRLLPPVAGKPEDEDAPDWAQEPEYEDPA